MSGRSRLRLLLKIVVVLGGGSSILLSYRRFPLEKILPGGVGRVLTSTPIVPGSRFSWGEATHGFTRVPPSTEVVNNIRALARALEPYRRRVGAPMNVTSWYRPEPFNSAAGGVRNSSHLNGRAVDFWVEGWSGSQLYDLALSMGWDGGVGRYLSFPALCHLDIGAKRSWVN